jgi:hypothetical protein
MDAPSGNGLLDHRHGFDLAQRWIELAGAASIGLVWGWLLVHLAGPSRPTLQGAILLLMATVAFVGVVMILVDIRAMVTCALATGGGALLHIALSADLQRRMESHRTREMRGGAPR